MPQNEEVMSALSRTGALREGHFVFKSGLHCDHYTRPDDLIPHTIEMWLLAEMLAAPYLDEIDVVMGPHFAGNPLGLLVSLAMNQRGREVLWIPTRKRGESQIVEPHRGLERYIMDNRVLVVEDVTTTGGSPGKIVALARSHGGIVIAVAALCSYGADIAAGSGAPKATVLNEFVFKTYKAGECPQCNAKEPIVIDRSLGHGWEFERDNPDYEGGWVKLLTA